MQYASKMRFCLKFFLPASAAADFSKYPPLHAFFAIYQLNVGGISYLRGKFCEVP